MELNGRKDDLRFENNSSVGEDSSKYFQKAMIGHQEQKKQEDDMGFNVYGDDIKRDPDYQEFLQSEARRNSANTYGAASTRDYVGPVKGMVWHYIYAIMAAVGAGGVLINTLIEVSGKLFGSGLLSAVGTLVSSCLTIAYNVFVLCACVGVLNRKQKGLKQLRVKMWIDIVIYSIGVLLSLLFTVLGVGDSLIGGFLGAIGGILIAVFAIGLVVAIVTMKYYKNREHMFYR